MAELRMSVRAIDPDDSTKTVAVSTINGLSTGLVIDESTGGFNRTAITQVLSAMQNVTSAKIKSVSFNINITDSEWDGVEEDLPQPANPLNPDEIFTEDFSDVAVVPTLQVMNTNLDDNKSVVGANVKYMADPIDTTNFETLVATFAARLNEWKKDSQTFVSANMTLSAKDEVARAN